MDAKVVDLIETIIENNRQATNVRLDILEERQVNYHTEVMIKLEELQRARWVHVGRMGVISFLISSAMVALAEGAKAFFGH